MSFKPQGESPTVVVRYPTDQVYGGYVELK
jgi:hypothetical protein